MEVKKEIKKQLKEGKDPFIKKTPQGGVEIDEEKIAKIMEGVLTNFFKKISKENKTQEGKMEPKKEVKKEEVKKIEKSSLTKEEVEELIQNKLDLNKLNGNTSSKEAKLKEQDEELIRELLG